MEMHLVTSYFCFQSSACLCHVCASCFHLSASARAASSRSPAPLRRATKPAVFTRRQWKMKGDGYSSCYRVMRMWILAHAFTASGGCKLRINQKSAYMCLMLPCSPGTGHKACTQADTVCVTQEWMTPLVGSSLMPTNASEADSILLLL